MSIGIFDLGIGGLTVLKESLKVLPEKNYIYYADTQNVPYGTKPKEEVRSFIFQGIEFIANLGVEAVIVACNTATSVAVKELRERYHFPVIGMEPAVKPAVRMTTQKRVLVVATPLTLKEEKLQNLIAKVDVENKVDLLPLPELVGYAEQFIFDEQIIAPYLKEKFQDIDRSLYGAVVLGCTHFPFFKKYFKQAFEKETSIIDGNTGTVNRLKTLLNNTLSENGNRGYITYYTSGKKEPNDSRFVKYLKMLDMQLTV